MANRNFRNDQTQENVPDINMSKFIDSVGAYFPDLDMSVGQEKNTDPRASGFVLTFTNPRTAAMFAAYQIGRRSTEYVPGAFVLARLENNQLVFDDREVYLEHQEAARAQRNKSRAARRPHLLFSTTQKTMEYAAGVVGCGFGDFAVASPSPATVEPKEERFTPSQLKFLEKYFGRMMDDKVKAGMDNIHDALVSLRHDLDKDLTCALDEETGNGDVEEDSQQQELLQLDSVGLND